jgi:hypothetical protein
VNGIKVRTPKDVVSNIITLKQQLNDCGLRMFHTRTLDVMARIGVEYICSTHKSDETALIAFELPRDSGDEEGDYGNIHFFDKRSSTDNWSEEQEQSEEDSNDDSGELSFQSQGDILKCTNYEMNQNTWLGDSAASAHMGISDEGMTDMKA